VLVEPEREGECGIQLGHAALRDGADPLDQLASTDGQQIVRVRDALSRKPFRRPQRDLASQAAPPRRHLCDGEERADGIGILPRHEDDRPCLVGRRQSRPPDLRPLQRGASGHSSSYEDPIFCPASDHAHSSSPSGCSVYPRMYAAISASRRSRWRRSAMACWIHELRSWPTAPRARSMSTYIGSGMLTAIRLITESSMRKYDGWGQDDSERSGVVPVSVG